MLRHKTDDNLLDLKVAFFDERYSLIEALCTDSLPYIEIFEGKRDSMDIAKAKLQTCSLKALKI